MDLIGFIEARLREEQAAAEAVEPLGETIDMGGNRLPHSFSHTRNTYASEDGMPRRQADPAAKAHFARHDPARVLAQVAAMRAIVELYERLDRESDQSDGLADLAAKVAAAATARDAVRHLAAIWASHPDYDPAWAPEGE